MFYISATIYIIGAIAFVVLSSGEEQPWNTPEDELLQEVDIVREPRRPLLYSDDSQSTLHHQSINRV